MKLAYVYKAVAGTAAAAMLSGCLQTAGQFLDNAAHKTESFANASEKLITGDVVKDKETGLHFSATSKKVIQPKAGNHAANSNVLRQDVKAQIGVVKGKIEKALKNDGKITYGERAGILGSNLKLDTLHKKFEDATQKAVQHIAFTQGTDCTLSEKVDKYGETKMIVKRSNRQEATKATHCVNHNLAVRLDEIGSGAYEEGGKRYEAVLPSPAQ